MSAEFGDGFSNKNLWNMIRFAEVFGDVAIVAALRRQLSWTHFRRLIYIDDPLKRDFYAEMCAIERWSTRTLEEKISSMLSCQAPLACSRGALPMLRQCALRPFRCSTPTCPGWCFR